MNTLENTALSFKLDFDKNYALFASLFFTGNHVWHFGHLEVLDGHFTLDYQLIFRSRLSCSWEINDEILIRKIIAGKGCG